MGSDRRLTMQRNLVDFIGNIATPAKENIFLTVAAPVSEHIREAGSADGIDKADRPRFHSHWHCCAFDANFPSPRSALTGCPKLKTGTDPTHFAGGACEIIARQDCWHWCRLSHCGEQEREDHHGSSPSRWSIRYPETRNTQISEMGRKIFQPSRISWS